MNITGRSATRFLIGIYPHISITIISFATLASELAQNRVLSFQYWHHVVYFVITTALLGMAAGGAIYFYSQRLQKIPLNEICRTCLFSFSVLLIASTLGISKIDIGVQDLTYSSLRSVVLVLLAYSIIILPYVFFGICLSAVFQKLRQQTGKIYFLNLLGSAAGCLAFVVLVEPLGMRLLLVLLAVLCSSAAAFGFASHAAGGALSGVRRFLGPVAFVACIGAFLAAFSPTPDGAKQLGAALSRDDRIVETTVWHPTARLDVLAHRAAARSSCSQPSR
jgi:hypothetical protein